MFHVGDERALRSRPGHLQAELAMKKPPGVSIEPIPARQPLSANKDTIHLLLRPSRPDNRLADRSGVGRALARVALRVEALLRSSLNQNDAAGKINRRYSSIANLVTSEQGISLTEQGNLF